MTEFSDAMPKAEAQALIIERLRKAVHPSLSRADRSLAFDWIGAALSSDNPTHLALVELLLNEQVQITAMVNGEPSVRLTPAGEATGLELVSESAEHRATVERLTGRAFVAPPKDAQ